MQAQQLQTGGQGGRDWGSRTPAPELIGALRLEALFAQQGQASPINAGGGGEPAGGAAGPVNGLAQQGRGNLQATGGDRVDGPDRQTQVLDLPAAAAAIEATADDQPEDLLLATRA